MLKKNIHLLFSLIIFIFKKKPTIKKECFWNVIFILQFTTIFVIMPIDYPKKNEKKKDNVIKYDGLVTFRKF